MTVDKERLPSDPAYENPAMQARILYSFSWLSAVLTGGSMKMQLEFRLFPWDLRDRQDPVYQEEVKSGLGKYAKLTQNGSTGVGSYLVEGARPSGMREPWIHYDGLVTDGGGNTGCTYCAHLWRKPIASDPELFCALLAIVNTQSTTVVAKMRLKDLGKFHPQARDMVMVRADEPSEKGNMFFMHEFEVELQPYETQVFVTAVVDCVRGIDGIDAAMVESGVIYF